MIRTALRGLRGRLLLSLVFTSAITLAVAAAITLGPLQSRLRDQSESLLQETTDEMARNGCRKILIVNGHGGNLSLLPYFAQLQMQTPHDYVVYVYWRPEVKGADRPYKGGTVDMHAGESETAHTMVTAPGLVHTDRAQSESGADQARLHLPDGLYTGIWWYARFPNHYSGDGSLATRELGEYDLKTYVPALADVIRAVKADSESMKLQQQFYEDAKHPLETKQ